MAFKTQFDGKTIVTGIGLGRVDKKGGLKTTETTNGVAKAMSKAEAFNGRLVVCECRNADTAKQRVITALKAAQNGDGLLIICKDSEIYDEVLLPRDFRARKVTDEFAPQQSQWRRDYYECSL